MIVRSSVLVAGSSAFVAGASVFVAGVSVFVAGSKCILYSWTLMMDADDEYDAIF